MQIEKSTKIGFCFGVKRALEILERTIIEYGSIETLGEIVHNKQVIDYLSAKGVRIAGNADQIRSDVVVLSTHGVSPDIEQKIKKRNIRVIDSTCPYVHRAQTTARRLAKAGFFVIIFGDPEHSEVKGILGWAEGKGIASINKQEIISLNNIPRRIGILSQTTQIPLHFNEFFKGIFNTFYTKDSELRVIDTICHDIRERQAAALELAEGVDLMLVIGGRNSANTTHLTGLCSSVVETHQIETFDDIKKSWLHENKKIGVTSGASTSDKTIEEVIKKLKEM